MNLYDIVQLERDIEQAAIDNDGELTEEQWQMLIEAQTKSLDKVENVCKYIRHLEQFEQKANEEIARINDLKQKAIKRKSSIKKYLKPYVISKGKVDVGTFKLSTRKSTSVQLDDDFNVKDYMVDKTVVIFKPDKKLISAHLKIGKQIKGASLKENINLQIK
jgi:hypothetical protein